MADERTRWTDTWLDTTFEGLEHRLRGVETMRDRLLTVETETRECNLGVKSLVARIDKREEERKQERQREEERRYDLYKERRADRWKLAALLVTCMGIIISAVALLADKL